MKSKQWIAAIVVLAGIAACNYTVGDCWPVGQGDSTGDVGSGVINSTGPGNPGEGPTGQAQGALSGDQCNDPETPPPNNGATELNQVLCPKLDWGAECMVRCADEAGATCLPTMVNKNNLSAGKGLLSACCGCQGKGYCRYSYDNGDTCYLSLATKGWLCVPGGG